jgi:hypothetical protein
MDRACSFHDRINTIRGRFWNVESGDGRRELGAGIGSREPGPASGSALPGNLQYARRENTAVYVLINRGFYGH